MDRRRILLAVVLGVVSRLADARGAEKERAEVPTAEPVTLGTVRYEAPLWTRARGLPQNGGYLEAFDTRTEQSLWLLKVYSVDANPALEADKQDIFITRMTPDRAGRHLTLEDERGRRWRVDLASRRVTALRPIASRPSPAARPGSSP
jgi:hypothetical protein